MGWLFRVLFGLDPGEVPPGGVARFELAGMPAGFWAAAALAIGVLSAVLVILIYRRESELGAWKRAVLTGLRLLALALVIIVLLNPRLVVVLEARRLAQTLLLVDGSGSMAYRDRYEGAERAAVERASGLDPGSGESGGPTRAELVAAALERSDLVGKMGRANRPRPYLFDEVLTAEEPAALAGAVREAPRAEKSTWLGSAIRGALDAARADPVAAVVVISDGKSNGGDSLAGAASELESRGIPLHALGVGRIDLPKNIAVAEVNAPEVAESGLPIRIRVRIRATGFPGDAQVKLSRKRSGEQGYEPVGTETVQLAAFEAEAVVNLTDVPPRDGRYRFLAQVEARPGEETARDNQRTAEVVVAGEKCRVLLIAGGPSREYRYLTRFFIRDPGIQVSAWLQSADREAPQDGDLVLRALPRTVPVNTMVLP